MPAALVAILLMLVTWSDGGFDLRYWALIAILALVMLLSALLAGGLRLQRGPFALAIAAIWALAAWSLLSATWALRPSSDRSGCRLEGPRLAHLGSPEITSDGMVPGCIQVPPDGQPIVMLADGPTTGGYPKIATVVRDDLRKLGQLVPGAGRVRFQATAPE